MNKNFTFVLKCITLIIIAIVLIATISYAQSSPKLSFSSPVLVSGTSGQKHATYKFSNVVAGVDAFVKIEDIKGGAVLINIDDANLGYGDAWQPTVGGPGTTGTSYINWSITFKTTAGADYSFPIMDLTAVDIDGDNSRLHEFIDVKGQSSYDAPTAVPTLLAISNSDDHGNGNTDNSGPGNNNGNSNNNSKNVDVLGPIANRTDIDTSSLDVKMNFHFTNQSQIYITTGAQVDNGNGGVSSSRYNSLYFKSTSNTAKLLPVIYSSFYATLNNNVVNLFWTTETEVSNDHFEVERSFDQSNFSTAGIVLGAQDVRGASSKYSFKDGAAQLASHNVVYYRLKQVDADGKFTYSTVKLVRLSEVSKVSVQVSPNPYMDKLNINFVSDASGNAEVRLISASGTLVKTVTASITKGYNNIQVQNLNAQPAGLYIANVVVNGQVIASLKVVKQ